MFSCPFDIAFECRKGLPCPRQIGSAFSAIPRGESRRRSHYLYLRSEFEEGGGNGGGGYNDQNKRL